MNIDNILRIYYDYGSGDSGALIAGSSQIAASAINAMSVSNSSKKDRQFMKDMYDQQRKDALADRDFANTYNSPVQEMARLKSAGLNPNLVYGKGAGDMTSAAVRGSSFTPYHRNVPDLSGIAGGVASYFNVKMQQQQLNNMAAQNQLLQAQTDETKSRADVNRANLPKIGAEISNIIAETNLRQFSYDIQTATREISIAIKNQELQKITADTTFTLDENQRKAIMNDTNVQQALTHIMLMEQQKSNLQADKLKIGAMISEINNTAELKKLDIDYIKSTGNTGRPGESPIAKLVELIYGKLAGAAKKNLNPAQNLPPNIGGYIVPNPNE